MPRAATVPLLATLLLAYTPARAERPSPVAPELVKANTEFAVDLYGALAKTPGNALFSPLSISTAFGLLRQGARGETAAQIDSALHLPKDVAPMYRELLDVLNAPHFLPMQDASGAKTQVPSFELAVANGVFGGRGWALRDEFRRTAQDAFGAGLEPVDFEKPDAARAAINRWVEQKTRDKIRDLLPPGQPAADTRLVVANAVYFKATWKETFSKEGTANGPFHAPGGDVSVPLMHQKEAFPYAETPEVQVLELPYVASDATLFVVLPRAADGLPALEKSLTAAAFQGWLDSVKYKEVELTFPKFKVTVASDLIPPLRDLGMKSAFDPKTADFGGITEQPPLYVTGALHKTFLSVDEDGSEAAAATAVVAGITAAPAMKSVAFTADHPFLFGIRHRATGTILFLGRVVDPTK